MGAIEATQWYAELSDEDGFESRCHMVVPNGLEGMTALDVCCRRGKGVFKLSDRVGENGLVIGVDWREDMLAEARANTPAAMERNGFAAPNVEFRTAFPEDLQRVADGASVDVAFINSVLNLTLSPRDVLRQIALALKPGGLLVCQTVVADRTLGVSAPEARDAVSCAPTFDELLTWLDEAGFDLATLQRIEEQPVRQGFTEVVLHVRTSFTRP